MTESGPRLRALLKATVVLAVGSCTVVSGLDDKVFDRTPSAGTAGDGGSSEGAGGAATGGVGGMSLECEPGWDFPPVGVTATVDFEVVYHTVTPGDYVDVGFDVSGEGFPGVGGAKVIGDGGSYPDQYAWSASVSGHQQGRLDLIFSENIHSDPPDLISACSIMVQPAP